MADVYRRRSTTQQRWRAGFLVLATLLAFPLTLRVLAGPAPEPVPDDTPATPATAAPAELPASAAEAATAQADAQAAVRREIGRPELAGPLTSRPAYVSEMEWLALQAVAQKSTAPARELTRLVNNLRFHKLLDLWRHGGPDTATRQRLGEALLAAIPARVQQKEYTRNTALQLQQELLAALEPDPARREVRRQAEAQRLGTLLQEGSGTSVP